MAGVKNASVDSSNATAMTTITKQPRYNRPTISNNDNNGKYTHTYTHAHRNICTKTGSIDAGSDSECQQLMTAAAGAVELFACRCNLEWPLLIEKNKRKKHLCDSVLSAVAHLT